MPLAPLETPEELEALHAETRDRLNGLSLAVFQIPDFNLLPLKKQWAIEEVLACQWADEDATKSPSSN